jgi:lysophospholipase L1-like esterase
MKSPKLGLSLSAFFLFLAAVAVAQRPDTATSQWEGDIEKFERADSLHPPPQDAILFVGSSSIRMWKTLRQDFPAFRVINRGFGGSEMADAVRYANRIILPYRPRMVIVYAGDNDLANGKKPEQIFSDYKELVRLIRQHLPKTRIAFISVKPSLDRWRLVEKIRTTNRLIQQYSLKGKRLAYIDIFTPMLGKDGTPRKELFAPDGLHLNAKGYALWVKVVKPFLLDH